VIGGKGVVVYKNSFLPLLLLALLALPFSVLVSCAAKPGELPVNHTPGTAVSFLETENRSSAPDIAEGAAIAGTTAIAGLDEIAELERSGGFVPGLGLAESKLREGTGDYAGAVLAVYKELSWAYALGAADVSREAIRQGMEKLLEPGTVFLPDAQKKIAASVRAILAYFEGRYDEAEKSLTGIYGKDGEVDGFSRFLLLVCALEKGNAGREERSLYSVIRSRYAGFPEYWYRFARYEAGNADTKENADSGKPGAAGDAGAHAERCINLAPEGPYAAECRTIFAKAMGLKSEDAPSLKTRLEIETAVTAAVNQKNPEMLSQLLPLAALPDNPSTLYACAAMRSLAGEQIFRTWFVNAAEKAKGRLAERLFYISRG